MSAAQNDLAVAHTDWNINNDVVHLSRQHEIAHWTATAIHV